MALDGLIGIDRQDVLGAGGERHHHIHVRPQQHEVAGLVDPRMRIEIEVTARRAVRPPSSAAAQRRRTAKPKAKKKAAKRAGKKGRR